MKILITNFALSFHTGTELLVRDLASAFVSAGDQVCLYSPKLGGVAQECRALGAVVTNNIHTIDVTPDVIHGHHSVVIAAALKFPCTPIVYACHGVIAGEWPIKLPTIEKYVAVSNLTRARLSEAGIEDHKIEVISNFADTDRFKTQRILPHTARKALLFGNYWRNGSAEVGAITEGCRRYGISIIDVRGALSRVASHPEFELPNYDVVFAVGRSAIEAMATGTSVILADLAGIGGMVMPANFDRLQSMNFALEATRSNLLTADSVYKALLTYDRAQADAVTRRVRGELSLDAAAARWKNVYGEAIRSSRNPKVTVGGAYYGLFVTKRQVFFSKWRGRGSAVAFAMSLLLLLVRQVGSLFSSV